MPWHVHLPVEARAAFVPKVSHPIARHRTAQFSNIVAQAPPVLCHICPNGRLTGVRRVRNTTEINENMLQNWQKRLQNIHGTDLLTKSKAFKNPKISPKRLPFWQMLLQPLCEIGSGSGLELWGLDSSNSFTKGLTSFACKGRWPRLPWKNGWNV